MPNVLDPSVLIVVGASASSRAVVTAAAAGIVEVCAVGEAAEVPTAAWERACVIVVFDSGRGARFARLSATLRSLVARPAATLLAVVQAPRPTTSVQLIAAGATAVLTRNELTTGTIALAVELGRARRDRRIAEQTATELARTFEEFVSVASHELRGPLSTILLASDVLASTQKDEQARAHIRTIERCVARSGAALDQLHRQVSIDQITLRTEEVDARDIVLVAMEESQETAARKSCSLAVSIPAHRVAATLDYARMNEALADLVRRAITVAQGQGVTIGLEERPGEVVFTVDATGVTIAPDQLSRVYERSWRGPRGTGALEFGAAMVRSIVKHHGGRAAVSSNPRTTRFELALPRP